jgi:hypothetical protein
MSRYNKNKIMKLFFLIVALLSTQITFSQQNTSYTAKLPEGYKLLDVNNELGTKIESDFDKDGIIDLAAILYAKDDNSAILTVFLSSNFKINKSYQKCEWFHMTNDFEINKEVLKLSSIDMNKYYTEIKLKYDPQKKNMKIISYNEDDVIKKPKFKLIDCKL